MCGNRTMILLFGRGRRMAPWRVYGCGVSSQASANGEPPGQDLWLMLTYRGEVITT